MSDNSNKLEARLTQREAKRRERKELAEGLKDDGNEMFRNGQYVPAAQAYGQAIQVYGARAVYINNTAAVALKLGQYEMAALAATEALFKSPSLLKARYRRGLARKEIGTEEKLKLAMEDFNNCLKQDPKCAEAAMQYEQTGALLLELQAGLRDQPRKESANTSLSDDDSLQGSQDGSDASRSDKEDVDEEDEEDDDSNDNTTGPLYTLSDLETDVESDSDDYGHEGKYACKDYNRLGCEKGRDCIYRHGPDDSSVRDRLGRNVCLFWLLDVPCKFGKEKCVYAHDRRFLPPGWWDFPDALADYKNMIKWFYDRRSFMPGVLMMIERKYHKREYGSRRDVAAQQASKKELKAKSKARRTTDHTRDTRKPPSSNAARGRGNGNRGNGRGRSHGRGGGRSARPRWTSEDDEFLERISNFGFTEGEVMELASQGVKPWDDDAGLVLAALSSY